MIIDIKVGEMGEILTGDNGLVLSVLISLYLATGQVFELESTKLLKTGIVSIWVLLLYVDTV